MKKTIVTLAALAILTIANANAQRGHYPAPAPQVENPRIDNALEELSINRLDNIVKLTRKQENELKRIENRYDRLLKNRRLSYRDTQRLQQQKQQEIWSVLTPVQRQRLAAHQHNQRFDRPYRRG
jgi:Spy/CpxP family protein refolding chaperone